MIATTACARRRRLPHQRAAAGCSPPTLAAGSARSGRAGYSPGRAAAARPGGDGCRARCARVFAEHGHRADHDRGAGCRAPTSPPTIPTSARPGRRRCARIVDLTVALGGDQMNGVPYGLFGPPAGPTSRRGGRALGAARWDAVADYAHERGVTMTFEVLNRYETSLRQHRRAGDGTTSALSGSEHLRIHLDTFHMAVEEADIAAADPHGAARARLPRARAVRARGCSAPERSTSPRSCAQALDDGYAGRGGASRRSRARCSSIRAADMLAIWRSPYDDGQAGRGRRDARDPARLVGERRRPTRAATGPRRSPPDRTTSSPNPSDPTEGRP